MDCVNHPGAAASAYCQNCGKPLCPECTRTQPSGQILCAHCLAAWPPQTPFATPVNAPFAAPFPAAGAPNPTAAAWLGLIPGVGAMYNGQFIKGFLHVLIFAVLVSISHAVDAVGIVVLAWMCYQVFDAYQTARARRDGHPLPDPLGMNELVNWITREMNRSQGVPPPASGFTAPQAPPASGPTSGAAPSGYVPPQPPNPWQGSYPPYPPPYGPYPGYPNPPIPPANRRGLCCGSPVGAIVLIALGTLFLLGQINDRVLGFTWPVVLIGIGLWLIFRRLRDTQCPPPPPPAPPQTTSSDNPQGGMK